MTYYIGIDPGKSGGIAVLNKRFSPPTVECAVPLPLAGKEIDYARLGDLIYHYNELDLVVACIEKVGPMVHRRKDGSLAKEGTVSMFTFGIGVGALYGIMAAFHIKTYKVAPQTWKKHVLADTSRDKESAIAFCRMVYPDISLLATERSKKPHTGIADALCIATYAIIKY